MNVKKKDGRTEPFDKKKLERSIRETGADERTVKDVAATVREKEGMTTDDIRKSVTEELKKRKKELADRYNSTISLEARKAVDAAKGTARITEQSMKRLNIKTGDTLELVHKDKKHKVRTEKANIGRNEIRLHEDDLRTIGATEGTRIAARRRS